MQRVDHMGAGGKPEPGPKLFRNRSPPGEGAALKDLDPQARPGEIRRGHQPVVSRPHNNDIHVRRHCFPLRDQTISRQTHHRRAIPNLTHNTPASEMNGLRPLAGESCARRARLFLFDCGYVGLGVVESRPTVSWVDGCSWLGPGGATVVSQGRKPLEREERSHARSPERATEAAASGRSITCMQDLSRTVAPPGLHYAIAQGPGACAPG